MTGLAGLVTCTGPGRWGGGPWWLGLGFGGLVLVTGWRLLGWGDDAVARLPLPAGSVRGRGGQPGDARQGAAEAAGSVEGSLQASDTSGWSAWETQARRYLMTLSRVSRPVRSRLLAEARERCDGREPVDELGDAGAWASSVVRSDPQAARSHAGWTAVGFLTLAGLSLPWPVWVVARGESWGRPAAWMLCTLLWLMQALVYVRRWRAGAR